MMLSFPVILLSISLMPTQKEGTRDTEKLAANARTVLSALVKAADDNRRLAQRDAPGAWRSLSAQRR